MRARGKGRLLEPGWAGELDDAEAEHIAAELTKSPVLRRQWRVCEVFGRHRRKISPALARRLAAYHAAQNDTGRAEGHFLASHQNGGGAGPTEPSAPAQVVLR